MRDGRTPGKTSAHRLPSSMVAASGLAILLGLAAVAVLVYENRAPVSVVSPLQTTPSSLAHGRELGSTTAPVVLDVWSDFQCPYCLQFWTRSEPPIVATFVGPGQVRLVYHDFTFIGPESLDAAVAARCADRQGGFWVFHDLLFANQGKENSGAFSADRLTGMATVAGLDVGAWSTCRSDPTVQDTIAKETAEGQALGVSGTPTLFVNGARVGGFDFPTVSAAIEGALPGTRSPAGSGTEPASPSGAPSGSEATPAVSAQP